MGFEKPAFSIHKKYRRDWVSKSQLSQSTTSTEEIGFRKAGFLNPLQVQKRLGFEKPAFSIHYKYRRDWVSKSQLSQSTTSTEEIWFRKASFLNPLQVQKRLGFEKPAFSIHYKYRRDWVSKSKLPQSTTHKEEVGLQTFPQSKLILTYSYLVESFIKYRDIEIIQQDGRNVLFNYAFITFYLRLYGVGHMAKDDLNRQETCCYHYMGYSFQLAARDHTNRIAHPSHGALAGMGNCSVGSP